MTPAAIIREAQAEGVRLALSPAGSIKASGERAAVARWQSVIRSHKAQIIEALKTEAGDKAGVSCWWRVCYCDRPPLEILYPSGAGRAEVLAAYPGALEAYPFTPCIRRPSSPLSGEEETLLRRWLAQDGETDPAIIAATIDQCQRDAHARHYFINKRAAAELPQSGSYKKGGRYALHTKTADFLSCSGYLPVLHTPQATARDSLNRGRYVGQ